MTEGEPKRIREKAINMLGEVRRVPGRVWGVVIPRRASFPETLVLTALDLTALAGSYSIFRPDLPIEVVTVGGMALTVDVYLRIKFLRRR